MQKKQLHGQRIKYSSKVLHGQALVYLSKLIQIAELPVELTVCTQLFKNYVFHAMAAGRVPAVMDMPGNSRDLRVGC
jgi:hypothetical protein